MGEPPAQGDSFRKRETDRAGEMDFPGKEPAPDGGLLAGFFSDQFEGRAKPALLNIILNTQLIVSIATHSILIRRG